jgi:hypothetical protein
MGGILEQISECQEIALDNHPQAGVVDRCVEFFEGFTQGGELQPVGSDNGLELLRMEGMAQDSFDSDQQIEEEERRRDGQDEDGHDYCFPQSSCQFCQEYGNTRNRFAPAQCSCRPWLRSQLKGSSHDRQQYRGTGTACPPHPHAS